jgi:glycosyltransferase involved in cell wall biosynthesis
MKIGIVICTYQRPDGKTPFYLRRALQAILNQTHKDYRVYIVGDAYADRREFISIMTEYVAQMDIRYMNLLRAVEREKYRFGTRQLWCAGGLNAGLTGIDWALHEGYKYICHHDHDDWWEPNHLELINKVIEEKNPFFICTVSTWMKSFLPKLPITNEILDFYPIPEGMINSSSCIEYSETSIRPRDVYAETGVVYPADADLWKRLTEEMKEKGHRGYIYTTLTCHHDEEGYTLRCRE